MVVGVGPSGLFVLDFSLTNSLTPTMNTTFPDFPIPTEAHFSAGRYHGLLAVTRVEAIR